MAYITIKTDTDESCITFHEHVAPSNMESDFYCTHLVERLRWAVEDAHRGCAPAESIAATAVDGVSTRPYGA